MKWLLIALIFAIIPAFLFLAYISSEESSGFVTFLTAIFTYFYVALTAAMVWQIKRAQDEERRPFIIVDIEFQNQLVYLCVRNIGKIPAKKLSIETFPDIETSLKKKLSETVFSEPINFFPPGKEYLAFIDTSPHVLAQGQPTEYRVKLKYHDHKESRSFSEEYVINFGFTKNRGIVVQKDISDFYRLAENTNRKLDELIRTIETFISQ